MAEITAVQVRMDPDLHAQVADYAERHYCSRNAAYQALIEQGLRLEAARLHLAESGTMFQVPA